MRGVISSREAIRSAKLTVRCKAHFAKALGARGRDTEAIYEVLYSSSMQRIVRTESIPVVKQYKLPPNTKIDARMTGDKEIADKLRRDGALVDEVERSVVIVTPDKAYRYWDGRITLHDAADMWRREGFDFRTIGLAVHQPDDSGPVDMIRLLSPEDQNWVINEPQPDSPKGIIEMSRAKENLLEKLWVSADKGLSVIRREVEWSENVAVLDAELANWDGVWFPAVVRRSRQSKDDTDYVGVMMIENCQFNLDVDDDEFSVAALGAPPRTRVVDYRTKADIGYWDGERIVENSHVQHATERIDARPISDEVGGGDRWTSLLWIASGAGLIAALAISLYRRRQLR